MRRIALVVWWSVACARQSTTPPPEPPPTTATATFVPTVDDRVRLQWVDTTTLEVVERGVTRREVLDVQEPGGAVLLAAGATTGAVVPLDRVIDGTGSRTFAIEATASCRMPWIIDVDAALLVADLEVRGAPSSLRVGCGPLQHVDLVTAFGLQRVVVYGDAGFDVRIVAAELGIIRTELERIFAVHVARRWLDEVVVEPGDERPLPRARATTTGLRMSIGANRGWDAAPRLEVGATVARVWLAKSFDVIAAAPAPAAMHLHAALVHGVAHGIARESLFALGLLSPVEYARDVDAAEALVAERATAWRVAGAVDARDVAAAAAGHSIEAARVAWSLRSAGGVASVPEALERAAADGGVPATTLWTSIVAGASTRSLGPCVVPREVRGTVLDLGYAVAWDPQRGADAITALREDAPAAKAGLRVGDRVLHVDPAGPAVRVWRDGQSATLEVPARPRAITRRGWTRRAGVADDRCYPSS